MVQVPPSSRSLEAHNVHTILAPGSLLREHYPLHHRRFALGHRVGATRRRRRSRGTAAGATGRRAAIRIRRADERGPHRRRGGRRRQARRVLRRRRVGRRVEDHRRRLTWKPTFDNETSQAIGALAVAQSNPNIVWAGTGEAWAVRDMDMMGDGIYKSTDAGETWTKMGLAETGRIGTIVVHPTNENIVLVCALGRATGPQKERGVFRTRGRRQDLAADAVRRSEHRLLRPADVAEGSERRHRRHVGDRAADARARERRHGQRHPPLARRRQDVHEDHAPGLPKSPYGKTDVAIAPSDGNRMYALIQTGADGVKGPASREAQGSLWRSDDGGKTWNNVSWDRRLIGRAGYYIRIRVSPDDPDHLLIANSTLWRSRDGGKIWVERRRRLRRLP